MNVFLNNITGLGDACVAMLMSKRSWTREKELDLRKLVKQNTEEDGTVYPNILPAFEDQMKKLVKYGVRDRHTTLLRYIDLSFTVEGLHRAGQDDWDAHAKRFDNRIIRASTRLGTFKEGEISSYYSDKIMFPTEIMQELGINLPEEVYTHKFGDGNGNGTKMVRVDYGYVRADLKDIQDVKRGLYPESIPSNFTFKIQYPELCHVIQFRDKNGHAHPEVQLLSEMIKELVTRANFWLGSNLTVLKMEPK